MNVREQKYEEICQRGDSVCTLTLKNLLTISALNFCPKTLSRLGETTGCEVIRLSLAVGGFFVLNPGKLTGQENLEIKKEGRKSESGQS